MRVYDKHQSRALFKDLRKALIDSIGNEAGEQAYRLLIERFGGQRVTVPDLREYDVLIRNERIRRVFRETSDIAAIAERFGCSRMTVYRVVRRK